MRRSLSRPAGRENHISFGGFSRRCSEGYGQTRCRDKAQPVRQRRMVEKGVGNHIGCVELGEEDLLGKSGGSRLKKVEGTDEVRSVIERSRAWVTSTSAEQLSSDRKSGVAVHVKCLFRRPICVYRIFYSAFLQFVFDIHRWD